MNTNIGTVSIGYHLTSFMAEAKPISEPPVPHRRKAATTPTKPITAKTRCPVSSSTIMPANIVIAMNS